MTAQFRSILDVTWNEWLSGLKLAEDGVPDVVIIEDHGGAPNGRRGGCLTGPT